MAMVLGSITKINVGATTDTLQVSPTGATAPVTYVWHRSTISGFTAASSNAIAGAAAATLTDSGLTPGTTYYYIVVATDSEGTPVVASASTTVVTTAASPSPNQFAGTPYLGQLDQYYNGDTLPCQFDPTGSGTLVAGQAVKWSTTAGGVPKVEPSLSSSDVVAGYVNYNIKNAQFGPGDFLEISAWGNVMYLYATAAINRGQFLFSLPAAAAGGCNGGMAPVTGSSSNPISGWALDQGTQGSLFRVFLQTPAAPYAVD